MKNSNPTLRTPRSNLAALPAHVREELHRKLHDGWRFIPLRQWLFAQIADRDIPALNLKTGDPYSLIWTRTAKDQKTAEETCRYRIGQWYRIHHQAWLDQLHDREKSTAVLDHLQRLNDARDPTRPGLDTAGADLIVRAILFDALEQAHFTAHDPNLLIRLAQTWSRMPR
ncbi:MAG: hypothetical protein ABSH14_10320 [Verrucomicrobiia bacterium]|jgi:hypothetical protein